MKVKRLTFSALFSAIVFLTTAVFPITLPFGYVNMGDGFVLLAAVFIGPVAGAAAAGLGAALADFFLSYGIYAPATFVIKALMVLIFCGVGRVLHGVGMPAVLKHGIGALCAEAIMVLGYFVFESVLHGFAGALGSLAGNCLQGIVGIVSFCLLHRVFQGVAEKLFRKST